MTSRELPMDGPPISSRGPDAPDKEAHDNQDRDRIRRAGVARPGDDADSLDQLDLAREGKPEQEQRITHSAPLHLAAADQRQQRRHHEREPRHDHCGRPDPVPGDQREQLTVSALVNAISAADARMRCS